MTRPVFRFAPSPTGDLHLGHAYSALLNQRMAQDAGGRLLVRIEDIDRTRATPESEAGILADLAWLGLDWERPVRRQSEHLADYRAALDRLKARGLVYPAFMSRGEARAAVADAEAGGARWPRDPDGVPHYPPQDRMRGEDERRRRIEAGEAHSWRLDMAQAIDAVGAAPGWRETGSGPASESGDIVSSPLDWGDVVLSRRDVPASYALAVVVDDALQGVTHVVRGADLFHATAVQRLLQTLLGLPAPAYHHHRLILGPDGRKLSKSRGDTALASLRAGGASPDEISRMVGLA